MVHNHQPMAQEDAANSAQDRAGGYHDKSELQVVEHDLSVGEAEGLEDGNLLALEG